MWRSVPHSPPASVRTRTWYGSGSGSGTSSSSRRPGSITTAALILLAGSARKQRMGPRVDIRIDARIDETRSARGDDRIDSRHDIRSGVRAVRRDAEPTCHRGVVDIDEIDPDESFAIMHECLLADVAIAEVIH